MIDLDKMQLAIDFIESNLYKNITLDNIARRVGISKFHFHRIFKDIFEVTVTEYIRNRRLSNAAEQLTVMSFRVIDVAFNAKFNSQAAFTRSFKKLFGVNPTEFAENRSHIELFHRADLDKYRYQNEKSNLKIEIQIVMLKEIKLVGIGHVTPTKDMQFYRNDSFLCHAFGHQMSKIKNVIHGDFYTISTFQYGCDTSTFFCSLEVSAFEDVPENMMTRTVPEKTYARFIHRGKILENIHKTTDYFYLGWLPNSEYELDYEEDKNIVINRYTDKSNHLDDSEVEIFVPVKKRSS